MGGSVGKAIGLNMLSGGAIPPVGMLGGGGSPPPPQGGMAPPQGGMVPPAQAQPTWQPANYQPSSGMYGSKYVMGPNGPVASGGSNQLAQGRAMLQQQLMANALRGRRY